METHDVVSAGADSLYLRLSVCPDYISVQVTFRTYTEVARVGYLSHDGICSLYDKIILAPGLLVKLLCELLFFEYALAKAFLGIEYVVGIRLKKTVSIPVFFL